MRTGEWWKYTATAGVGVILSLLSYFAVKYMSAVDALEVEAAKNQTLLEQIREDVRWIKQRLLEGD